MNNADTTLPMATPPISSSSGSRPQETLLQRGMFDPPVTPGTLGHLDRFEILRLLGEGGMGQVYLAREPRTDTRVAVKILRPQMADDPQSVHRFLTEARHMYRLSHPRILRVLEVSDRKEGPYYVMPYVEGGSLLGQYAPDRPMPTERILSIANQVAEALAHAHAHGLIHRDLKPGNVLLDTDGNAYLTDFGLVRTVFNDSMVDASSSHLEGTAPYMSPAVARGEAEDTRCDIYAFGALLYELLAGQPPYTGRTCQIILDQVLKGPPTPLREVNPKTSPALVKIAEGCLARELHARYATMTDVVSDLALAAKGAMPLGPHQQEQLRRLPRLAALLVGTLAVAVLAMVAAHHYSTASSVTAKATGVPSPASGVLAQTSVSAATAVHNPSAANASLSGDGPESTEVDALSSSMVAQSPTAKVQGPFAFTVSNGKATITKYTGPGGEVTIPDTLGGLPVVDIGYRAFKACSSLTNVVIPNGVVTLGAAAFSDCPNLACAVLPASLTNISRQAFANCPMLTNAALPKGLSRICWGAFSGCSRLSDLTIPATVTSIEHDAFAWCSASRVTIPASVSSMGANPFRCCSKMTSVVVEEANPFFVSTDGGVLFDKERTSILCYPGGSVGGYTIPNGVTRIGDGAFRGCGGLASVTIPDSVTAIGQWTFHLCTNLTAIVIPCSVTNIGASTFYACDKLTAVRFLGDAPSFGSGIFDLAKNVTVYYRHGTMGWGNTFGGRPTAVWDGAMQGPFAFTITNGAITITKYTGLGGDVTIPSTINGLPVTTIGPAAFQNCTNLTGITIPNSVSHLGLRVFEYCTGLTSVTIPGSIAETGDRAFRCCTGLTNVTIQDGVTSVGFATFGGCTRLKSVVIPDSVTRIYGGAFRESSLPSITIPDSVTSIGPGAFMKTPNLTSVHFKGNAPLLDYKDVFFEINTNATVYYLPGTTGWGKEFGGLPTAVWNLEVPFTYTTNNGAVTITKYTGPGGAVAVPRLINGLPVTVIGDRAFNGCGGLTSVTLPDSVSRIEPFAFGKCFSLASVNIPSGVTSIGEWAFNGCGALTSAVIPAGVSNLAERVFFDCGSLASVVLPSGVTHIGAFAFGKCGSLTSIAIPAGVTRIGEWAFSGCGALTAAEIPSGVSNIEDRVFFDCNSLTSVMLPSGVTNIGMFAFGKCRALTSVTVPSGVTSVGTWAFNGCSLLEGVYFNGNAPSLGSDVFLNTQKATVYYLPGTAGWGKQLGGRPTAMWQPLVSDDDDGQPSRPSAIPPTAKVQGPFAYTVTNGAVTLVAYTGPGGAVAIPNAINGLPVIGIGDPAFSGCTNLTRVTIPNSVKGIGLFSFGHCANLATVTIPSSVTWIGFSFADCSRLTSITVDAANPAYSSSADGVVFNKAKTKLIRCPGGKAGRYVIPSTVTEIGNWAFSGCSSLTHVTIPDSVTNIGEWTFNGCTGLTDVTIPESVTNIRGWAFAGCAGLTRVTLPDSVTAIDRRAFKDCTGLTSLTIPASVTLLGRGALYGCINLEGIHFLGNAPRLDVEVFDKDEQATVYYRPGTKGWGPTFGGRPTAEWKP